jgi:hypothetical protein
MGRRISLAAAAGLAVFLVLAPTAAASPPTISYSIDGVAGANGWYRGSSHGSNVVLRWVVSGDTLNTDCLPFVTILGPTAGTTRTCWAENADGRTTAVTRVIKIDADPPTGVGVSPARPPDFKGWYNHPLPVSWRGSDATSGIATCSSINYTGPGGPGIVVVGRCADNAGNATSVGLRINYDSTPPTLGSPSIASSIDAHVIRWSSSSGDRIVIRRSARGSKARSTVFRGSGSRFVDKRIHPDLEYLYSIRAFDQAGNASPNVSVAGLPKVLTLQKLHYVPRVAPKPILQWKRSSGATYYNVQLFRGSKRVMAAWPLRHQLGLPTTWRWAGHRYRLRPGLYRWYVWAGLGARSFAQYRAIGSAKFIVPKRSR